MMKKRVKEGRVVRRVKKETGKEKVKIEMMTVKDITPMTI